MSAFSFLEQVSILTWHPVARTLTHCFLVPFPDGYGATVHFFWPGKGFQLLGMLSNEKPSAIFRLRGTFSSASAQSSDAQTVFSQQGVDQQGSDVTAILGLSIEPLAQIQAQLPAGQVSNCKFSVFSFLEIASS
jgi:Protein of unknown function (DUF775)